MSVFGRLFNRKQETAAPVDIAAILEAGREEGYWQAQQEQHWQTYGAFDTGALDTIQGSTSERDAYETQSAFTAAINNVVTLTLGTGVTYGEMRDETAYAALEEWYRLNDLENYSSVMMRQYLLDGELLALLAMNAGRNEPAWINLWDTINQSITINTMDGNPRLITSIIVGSQVRTPDSFTYQANTIRLNSQRGMSPMRTAVEPAVNYSRLLRLRVRAHEIRGRINAVYYALARNAKELSEKASRYLRLPRDGNVITLQMDPETGQSEKLEVLTTKTDAQDAEADIRAQIRAIAMVAGIPEHFMAVGDTANLATAKAMSEPMIRRMESHQNFITGFLTDLFRKELKRRYGEARKYAVTRVDIIDGRRVERTEYVTADNLDIPFSVPPVRDEEGTDLERIKYGHERGLVSDQTATEELGFDPALEAERLTSDNEDDLDDNPEVEGDA